MTVAVPETPLIEGLDQYFTGERVARKMVEWAMITRGMNVLEPSAGDGAIARFIPKNTRLTCIESHTPTCDQLRRTLSHPVATVLNEDFEDFKPTLDRFDVTIMNPPYGNGADGRHLRKAVQCSKRVISLVRANALWGWGRYQQVWRWAELTRMAVLTRRPVFYGPADKGHTARHDYAVIELVSSDDRDLEAPPDRPELEWWTDRWVT